MGDHVQPKRKTKPYLTTQMVNLKELKTEEPMQIERKWLECKKKKKTQSQKHKKEKWIGRKSSVWKACRHGWEWGREREVCESWTK